MMPSIAMFIARNIGVEGTPVATVQVETPSIFHSTDPGAQITPYVCQSLLTSVVCGWQLLVLAPERTCWFTTNVLLRRISAIVIWSEPGCGQLQGGLLPATTRFV